jgi:serine/threonine protein kinase
MIGQGAMGVVLRAHDPRLDRTVAIKVLASWLAANPTARKRFTREARAAARISDEHVIKIYDSGEDSDRRYLVMECVEGVSLHNKIKEGPLHIERILRIGSQIAVGLAATHRQGLIHRDIKPSNILLAGEGWLVKITDYGLARAVDDLNLTRTGEVLGTPMYMSPEQAAGQPIDHRTDLFSLGSVLYTMCTGQAPFPDGSALVVMRRVLVDTPRPVREINPEVPAGLIEIVDRLHRKDPDERLQTAQEVSDLLSQQLDRLRSRGPSHRKVTRSLDPVCTSETTIASSGPEARPGSLDQFLNGLSLVHPGCVDGLVGRLRTEEGPPDVARVANQLVRDAVLTPYQAEALYQGKAKDLLIGPYVVLDRIGGGGMGSVYKAVHRQLRVVAALKVLHPSYLRRKRSVVERFQREAEALARLNHPNIVCCLEPLKKEESVYYLVLEYVDGRDLRVLVEENGVFPVVQAIECLLQVAKGLMSAHAKMIIHRDIKPANLMLIRNTEVVRILDFGLARVMPLDPWLLEVDDGAASRAILGTIPYMSPEQASDSEKTDARSDIYSLGCTLHFLLTGRPPYSGRSWSEMLRAHQNDPIPSLRAARPSVPGYLDDLFRRMLAKDPKDRPPTMGSVIASLELAMAESRNRPDSSQTIRIRPSDEPQERSLEPNVGFDGWEIEPPVKSDSEEMAHEGKQVLGRIPSRTLINSSVFPLRL